jgi:multidrug efflux system membrane fusion protein
VYVIEEGKAKIRPIKLGSLEGPRTSVLEGLTEGEQVVLEGIDRLWEGKEVKVMEQPLAEGSK